MYLQRLLINNFRNLVNVDFNPGPGFNFITGPNGSGKTSVIEAIYYLSLARSFRTSSYQYLIHQGSPAFNLYGLIHDKAPQNHGSSLSASTSFNARAASYSPSSILSDSATLNLSASQLLNASLRAIQEEYTKQLHPDYANFPPTSPSPMANGSPDIAGVQMAHAAANLSASLNYPDFSSNLEFSPNFSLNPDFSHDLNSDLSSDLTSAAPGTNSPAAFANVADNLNSVVATSIGMNRERNGSFTVKINSDPITRMSDLVDHISVQLIHPQGVDLITKEAEGRRRFVDWGVYYADPNFKYRWADYRKLMKQRNALLRRVGVSKGRRNFSAANPLADDSRFSPNPTLGQNLGSGLSQNLIPALGPGLAQNLGPTLDSNLNHEAASSLSASADFTNLTNDLPSSNPESTTLRPDLTGANPDLATASTDLSVIIDPDSSMARNMSPQPDSLSLAYSSALPDNSSGQTSTAFADTPASQEGASLQDDVALQAGTALQNDSSDQLHNHAPSSYHSATASRPSDLPQQESSQQPQLPPAGTALPQTGAPQPPQGRAALPHAKSPTQPQAGAALQQQTYLRSGRTSWAAGANLSALAEITVWDEALARLADEITLARHLYLQQLTPVLQDLLDEFLPLFKLKFELNSGWEKGLNLAEVLAQNLEKDRVLGYTLYGCHRADLKIKNNNLAAGAILSRGQLKMLVYAMRLAQGILLKQQTKRSCIYLIDDLNSELDEHSQEVLLHTLLKCQHQVFISNIQPEPPFLTDSSTYHVFSLDRGVMTNHTA